MVLRRRTVFLGISLLLSGCLSEKQQKSIVVSDQAKGEARQAYEFIRSKGAAIVVRVSLDGEECSHGSVTLRKIVANRVSQENFTVIGQIGTINNESAVSELPNSVFDKKALIDALTFSRSEQGYSIRSNLSTYDSRISFRPISPGKYVITELYCAIGTKRYTLVADFFGMPRKHVFAPIPGDNMIEVGDKQIIDAGVLNIVKLNEMSYLIQQKGKVESILTDPELQYVVKNNLPDLAPRIIYKKFSPFYPKI